MSALVLKSTSVKNTGMLFPENTSILLLPFSS